MTTDQYCSFHELKQNEALNRDYKISMRDVGAPVTIIAPHGGKIEPGTSAIAQNIAKNDHNYYCFEGIKAANNSCLHITSHRFDEPVAIKLLSKSRRVVAIHAVTGTAGIVYLGGLDDELKKLVADELTARGFDIDMDHSQYGGVNPDNICNRGATGQGVQLEITRDLRDDPNKNRLIADAVRAALANIKA